MISKRTVCVAMAAGILVSVASVHAAQVFFTPALTVSEQYTDNLFLSPDNEIDDFITRAGFRLNGQVLWRTAGLELDYSPEYSKYADNSDFDNWRHSASLYGWKEIRRNTRLEFRNTYLRTNDPTDESDALDPDNPLAGSAVERDLNRRGRDEYYTNVTEVRLTQKFGAGDSFYLAYKYSILRDVDTAPGQTVDDNDIRTVSGGVAYNFSNKWTLELDGYREGSTFEDGNDRVEYDADARLLYNIDRTLSGFVNYRHTVIDFDQDADEDYQIYQPVVGVEKRFQKNARISVGVGYYFQNFESSDDESSFIANTEIYKRWDYRLVYIDVLGTSGYDIDDGGVQDNGLRIYYEGKVELGYLFSPRLSSNIFVSYRYDEFPNAVPDRAQNTFRTGAGVNWSVLQWMSLGLAYNYNNLSSDIQADEYTANNVLLSITLVPVSPFRLN